MESVFSSEEILESVFRSLCRLTTELPDASVLACTRVSCSWRSVLLSREEFKPWTQRLVGSRVSQTTRPQIQTLRFHRLPAPETQPILLSDLMRRELRVPPPEAAEGDVGQADHTHARIQALTANIMQASEQWLMVLLGAPHAIRDTTLQSWHLLHRKPGVPQIETRMYAHAFMHEGALHVVGGGHHDQALHSQERSWSEVHAWVNRCAAGGVLPG